MPPQGELAIFDRSWYGRVLVERVEEFCTEKEWSRAYDEINAMEETLIDGGALLMKFYLHISKEEQLKRFEARAADPYKHWKISEEDWRNRKKWKEHIEAAEDMFAPNLDQSRAVEFGGSGVQVLRPAQGAEGGREEIHARIRRVILEGQTRVLTLMSAPSFPNSIWERPCPRNFVALLPQFLVFSALFCG